MKTELAYLYLFLIVALVLGPALNNALFFQSSKSYRFLHISSLALVLPALLLGLNKVLVVWLVFCLFSLFLQVKKQAKNLFSILTIASFIPFVFSIIASIWLVAGGNQLFLLGYNKNWSFYAALHGNFLGWIFLGCLAALARADKPRSFFYTMGCYLGFVFFLMIAFGIDGVPYVKAMGVIGLTLMLPCFIGLFLVSSTRRMSKALAGLSLVGILFSMSLAVINEFWVLSPQVFLGARSMVTMHGFVNSLVVVPLFYFALRAEGIGHTLHSTASAENNENEK